MRRGSILVIGWLAVALFASCSNMYWAGGPYAAATVDVDGRVGGVFGGGLVFGNTYALPSMNVNASQVKVNNNVSLQQAQYQSQGNSQGQSQSFPSGDDDDESDSSGKHKHGHSNGHGHGNGQANGHSKNHPDD